MESVRPKSVGMARRSGFSSSGSIGGGVGSRGGGVGSLFFRIGYFFGSSWTKGASFSFVAFGLLRRSRELSVPLGVETGASAAAAALLRRSSASFASFEDPPSTLGLGRSFSARTSVPSRCEGISDHGVSRNQSTADIGGGVVQSACTVVSVQLPTLIGQRSPPLQLQKHNDRSFNQVSHSTASERPPTHLLFPQSSRPPHRICSSASPSPYSPPSVAAPASSSDT